MDFIPHTSAEMQSMMDSLGLRSETELFRSIPDGLINPAIAFPEPVSEMEISALMHSAAEKNDGSRMLSFLGGGAYNHFIPQAVNALISRGDFATAYTPYQAEVSQGTLQAIYEFQTFMCRLTGMDVANASMYDGATSLAEAALMACRVTRKEKIAVSATVNPHYRRVLKTYLDPPAIELVEIPARDGITDLESLTRLDSSYAGFFVQHPNYFGILEPVDEIHQTVHPTGCLLGAVVYPHSLGLLKCPGQWGVDISIGDLQSLGIPLQFGGPYAGFVACKESYARQLPGRLVGRTKDADGRTGYVLTLQTREQHIRRAKATSNICTNQALCALAATIYMSLMGAKGLRDAAALGVHAAHALQQQLCEIDGIELMYRQPFFNEFLLRLPVPVPAFIQHAREHGILPGIHIHPSMGFEQEGLLVAATELTGAEDIERYVQTAQKLIEQVSLPS